MLNESMNGVPLPDELRYRVEKALGRKILEIEQGSIDTFSSFSVSDLVELSVISNAWGGALPCVAYVRFRLAGRTELRIAASFVDYVLREGNTIEAWLALDHSLP